MLPTMRGTSLIGSFSAAMLLVTSAVAQTAPPANTGAAPPPAQPPPPASTAQPPPPASTAQPPPPQAPPGAYPGYPPPGAAYPGYPPPGAYPRAKPPPKKLAYYDGMTIPQGYHLAGGVRRGPVIAGAVVLGIPWAFGLAFAAGFNYGNQGGWLAIPAAGPWLTLGFRKNTCASNDSSCQDGEDIIRTFLVLDAIMQTTGAAFLIWGIADKTKYLLRDDVVRVIGVAPTRIGSGYGLGMFGSF